MTTSITHTTMKVEGPVRGTDKMKFSISFSVNNFKNLKSVKSFPCSTNELPWTVLIQRHSKPTESEDTVGFFLQCNGSDDSFWSCSAEADLIIRSQGEVVDKKRSIKHKFCAKEFDWGYVSFALWDDIVNPEKGYIFEDCVDFKVNIVADSPVRNASKSKTSPKTTDDATGRIEVMLRTVEKSVNDELNRTMDKIRNEGSKILESMSKSMQENFDRTISSFNSEKLAVQKKLEELCVSREGAGGNPEFEESMKVGADKENNQGKAVQTVDKENKVTEPITVEKLEVETPDEKTKESEALKNECQEVEVAEDKTQKVEVEKEKQEMKAVKQKSMDKKVGSKIGNEPVMKEGNKSVGLVEDDNEDVKPVEGGKLRGGVEKKINIETSNVKEVKKDEEVAENSGEKNPGRPYNTGQKFNFKAPDMYCFHQYFNDMMNSGRFSQAHLRSPTRFSNVGFPGPWYPQYGLNPYYSPTPTKCEGCAHTFNRLYGNTSDEAGGRFPPMQHSPDAKGCGGFGKRRKKFCSCDSFDETARLTPPMQLPPHLKGVETAAYAANVTARLAAEAAARCAASMLHQQVPQDEKYSSNLDSEEDDFVMVFPGPEDSSVKTSSRKNSEKERPVSSGNTSAEN